MATTTTRPEPVRPAFIGRSQKLTYVCAVVLVALGAIGAVAGGTIRPLVGALIFVGVLLAVTVPMDLMQRSGRGIAAPMHTPEARWSMIAFGGAQAVATAAGAVWAASAGHTAFAISLAAWVVLSMVGVVAAIVGPRSRSRS